MSKQLVVTHPFADYQRGDKITDLSRIEAALNSNPHSVVAISAPDEHPAPAEPAADPQAAQPQPAASN